MPKNLQKISFKADLFSNFHQFYATFSHFLILKDPQVIYRAVAWGSIVAGVKGMSCTALRQTTAREMFSWPIENGKLQRKSKIWEKFGKKMVQEVTFSRFMGIYGQIFLFWSIWYPLVNLEIAS